MDSGHDHLDEVTIGQAASTGRWSDVTVTQDSAGIMHLSGELDLASGPYVAARLAEFLPRDGNALVDVRGLSFIDVSGCRALLQAATALRPPRRLVVIGASSLLVRILEMCAWRDLPTLELRGGSAQSVEIVDQATDDSDR
jgi:anti-anti-sigma factor